MRNKDWNAAKCIYGEQPTMKELMPDADLGKCVKPGCRNMVRSEQDKDRAFGCPTVRNDIPAKAFRSVADHQNYGDEPQAVQLLFPATDLNIGVQEADFTKLMHKNELKSLFDRLGYNYRPAKFNAIFNKSVQLTSDQILKGAFPPPDFSTVRGIMLAVVEMHDL